MKKIAAVIMILCLSCCLVSCGSGNKAAKIEVNTQTVYWVPDGYVYHVDQNCQYIKNRNDVESGTVSEAKSDGKSRVCKVCGEN